MKNLKENLYNPHFSHIYVEKEALNHPNTKKILEHFNKAKIIEIDHYKDVFSRGKQKYNMQKNSIKMILAVKKDNLIYEGAKVCEDFGNSHFYYTSTMMNCIYNCEYCYLQGMYSSANVVVFVNIEDILKKVESLLKKHPVYLCISYDTDILAFENVLGYGRKWIEFTKKHKDLNIELRTKSANFKAIEDLEPPQNMILAWTLSPKEIIKNYEKRTPSLELRIASIKTAIDKGWKVRVCFDPMLYTKKWKEYYRKLIEKVFNEIPKDKVYDVSIGVFRVSKDYLKIMRKNRKDSVILNYPYKVEDGVCSYPEELSKEMTQYLYDLIKKYISEEKIYI